MRIKAILKSMEGLGEEMKTLQTKANECKDGEQQKIYFEAFTQKSQEFKALKSDLDRETAIQNVLEEVGKARLEAEKTAARNINPAEGADIAAKASAPKTGTRVEQVHDQAKTERELCFHFIDFIKGKELPDQAKDALKADGNRIEGFGVELPRPYQKLVTMRAKQDAYIPGIMSTDAVGFSTDSGALNLIDPNFIAELLKYDVSSVSLYDLTRPVNVYNGRARFPKLDQTNAGDYGGVVSYWDAEGDAITQTSIHFNEESVSTNRLSCIALLSVESLRRSAIDLEAELLTQFRNSARRKMSESILFGTGTTQPMGVLNTDGINLIPRSFSAMIEYQDLVNLQQGCRVAQRSGARFVLADSAAGHLQMKVDNMGNPLFSDNTSMGVRNGLIGWPQLVHEFRNVALPAEPTLAYLGQKGDVIFGNWSNYIYGIEENIRVAKATERWFEYDKIGYKMVSYVAGKVVHPSAFCALV